MRSISLQQRFTQFSLAERISIILALLVLSILAVTGCKSKQDEAVNAAKQQAVATGQPQQVTSVDKDGNTTVSTVMPPLAGGKEATVTTKTYPAGQVPPTQASAGSSTDGGSTTDATTASGNSMQSPRPGGEPVIAPLDVTIPSGTTLPIRITQHISVKTAMAGDRFSGTMAESIRNDDGKVLIPRGTPVSGVISQAHKRGHFKGRSILSLRLTSMTMDGKDYALSTAHSVETKKGKGKRSAAMIGGGAGVGMLIGGIATGGVGLLAGGLAGGGAGTLLAGVTGNKDVDIPSESVVRFKLAEDLKVLPPH